MQEPWNRMWKSVNGISPWRPLRARNAARPGMPWGWRISGVWPGSMPCDYTIRLDDIMVTMFELVIRNEWVYRDEQGVEQAFERETLDEMYVNRRLRDEDLEGFTGSWEPRA